MSLRDKLLNETRQDRDTRDRQETEQRSHSVVHRMVEAMQSLCHLVANDFLGQYEKERLATVRPFTMKMENPALKGVFFPYLTIVARSVEITLKPFGPVFGVPFRADLSNGPATYALLWDGTGTLVHSWKIAPVADDVLRREEATTLSKENFEEAFEKLLGF
ncbi:MAG TPA: hypothetical protein VNE82_20970 [Candidatus Binataceae bacterium]|nr:hypothetical protein [Candidatus Binataceae bacterium]